MLIRAKWLLYTGCMPLEEKQQPTLSVAQWGEIFELCCNYGRYRANDGLPAQNLELLIQAVYLWSFTKEVDEAKMIFSQLRQQMGSNWYVERIGLCVPGKKTLRTFYVKDSNDLYHFLWSWGDEWAKAPAHLPELQAKFVTYEDYFANSFDYRVCRPLLNNYGVAPQDIKQYTKSNGQTAPIDRWRHQLMDAYRSGKRDPEDLCYELEQYIRRELEQPG